MSSDNLDENGFLIKIDPTTGAETMIGNLNMETPHVVTGIAWNTVNQTMYVLSSNSAFNKLHTINLETAELTEVGGELASRLGIWLVIDNAGNAFTMDIGTQLLYAIDLATGVATIVGPTGVSLRNAQDADFDPATGILYAGGYLGAGVSRMYSVNTTSGAFTDLGAVNGCAELGIVSIKGEVLGVSENALLGFSFYPNPTSDIVNLTSVNSIETVSIFNLLGQELVRSNINQKESKLDVSSLSKGTYILEVTINGKAGNYKFIKN